MNRKYRKTIIAGNWKMNKLPSEVKDFALALKETQRPKWCETVVCVPFVMLPAAIRAFRDARIAVGAQDVSAHEKGAYTGEVSAAMLKDLGVKYVIIGHSERRAYHGETDSDVAEKIKAALSCSLRPIVCVGESLQQRESGITDEWISMQVKLAIEDLSAEEMKKTVIAYEPIWAIGTGKTATAGQAGAVCALIRSVIRATYGARVARAIPILYGGSMNPSNASELLAQPDVDGGLIGGSSLKPGDFASIIGASDQ